MRAIVAETLGEDGEGLAIRDVPRPVPARGEVSIEVGVASFTPADRMLCAGRYYFHRDPAFIPGLTGVGVVVGHDAGLYGRYLAGRRVFFAPGYARDGAWSEWSIADANTVVPVASLSDDDAVGLGNALTAVGLVETVRSLGSAAVVVNAAAGNLAGLIATQCAAVGLGFIGVVRSSAQARALRSAGIDAVFVQGQADFAAELTAAADRAGARVLIDSLGGGASVSMMAALPLGSTSLVIGHLSRERMAFDALPLLLGRRLTVRAFGISEWMESQSFLGVLWAARQAQSIVKASARMEVAHRVGLDAMVADFRKLAQGASAGRTLIYPSGPGAAATD